MLCLTTRITPPLPLPPICTGINVRKTRLRKLILRVNNHLGPILSFPGGSDGKESACNAGDLGSSPGSRRFSWRREQESTAVFLPGEFQASLVVYSAWGLKESDPPEWPTLPSQGLDWSLGDTHSSVWTVLYWLRLPIKGRWEFTVPQWVN